MALEVDLVLEDGTQVALANTYALLATADPYHDLRGNVAWAAATVDERATALVNATQYLDFRWTFIGAVTFPGETGVPGQGLEWPRGFSDGTFITDCRGREWDEDEVPDQILDALYEYALIYLSVGRLLPDPTVIDSGDRKIKSTRSKLGPLEEEIRYTESTSPRILRIYAQADRILRTSGLLNPASSTLVIRA